MSPTDKKLIEYTS